MKRICYQKTFYTVHSTLFSREIVETEHLPLRAAILFLKCTEGVGIGSTFPHFLSVLYTHPQAMLGK